MGLRIRSNCRKTWVTNGQLGEAIQLVVGIGYYRREFAYYPGNVDQGRMQ